jgi:hypothetical protein
MIVKRKGIIKECGGLIRKIYKRDEKWKYININPPPHKIHKLFSKSYLYILERAVVS